MARKIKYYDCKTSGLGSCWHCDAKTNFVLETQKDEIFCCFACAVSKYKSPKLHRKVRMFEKSRRDDLRNKLHVKKGQKKTIMDNFDPAHVDVVKD